jgi:predicted SnoaL-like aldol condensation-catalyzing enzyme
MNSATHIHLKRNPAPLVRSANREQVEVTNTRESNKARVRESYDLAFNQRQPAEAVAKHIGNYYRQHNPGAVDGPEAYVEFVSAFTDAYPGLNVEFRRFVAENDLVAMHSRLVREPNDPGLAAMDLFRLQDGKIVEHWDTIQEVPENAANDNTMF